MFFTTAQLANDLNCFGTFDGNGGLLWGLLELEFESLSNLDFDEERCVTWYNLKETPSELWWQEPHWDSNGISDRFELLFVIIDFHQITTNTTNIQSTKKFGCNVKVDFITFVGIRQWIIIVDVHC